MNLARLSDLLLDLELGIPVSIPNHSGHGGVPLGTFPSLN